MNTEERQEWLKHQQWLRDHKICVVCGKKIRFWQSTGNTAGHIDCIYNKLKEKEE